MDPTQRSSGLVHREYIVIHVALKKARPVIIINKDMAAAVQHVVAWAPIHPNILISGRPYEGSRSCYKIQYTRDRKANLFTPPYRNSEEM